MTNDINLVITFRWITVFYPQHLLKWYTRRNIKITIAICWILPFLVMLPSTIGIWGIHALECYSRTCTLMRDENNHSPRDVLFGVGAVTPTIIMLLLSASMLIKIKVSICFPLVDWKINGLFE